MIKAAIRFVPAVLVITLATVAAQQTPAPTEFRFERPVRTGGSGPRRLAIDVTLLTGSRPFQGTASLGGGLSDLRFFDTAEQQMAYLLVPNPPAEPVWKVAATLPIAPVETPTVKSSGFEVDLGEALTIDRFRIDGLSPPFLKRVRLEGSGDRARWTLLVAEGTLFDLPEDRLRQVELAFRPGSYRYVRLTWDDTRSGRLPKPPQADARQVRTAVVPPPLTTPLLFERRPSEPGRSQFRVRLPAGRLPIVALDLDVGGGHVLREARVFEARLAGGEVVPTPLGTAMLKRVVQGDLTASALRVPIEAPIEPQLDLVIDDGNNPPIDLKGVTAVFAELPWIYFESTGDAAVARYGHPSLAAPRYDLEAVRATLEIDAMADASWGEARARPAAEVATGPAPALPTVGSALDASLFRYIRPIAPGDAGLVTVSLDAAALSHSQGAPFADVRVIDTAGRQVPYLVERASEPLSLDLSLERLSTRPAALPSDRMLSVYRVRWPFEQLPSPRLVLTTSARVFRREVTLAIEREPDRSRRDPWMENVVVSPWVHADQDTPAPALTLPIRPIDAKELLVIVDEGDNSPLPLVSARLLLPSYRLRLFRERGAALRLAYGRDDLSPPRYDLALLAPQLIGVAATDVVPGAEQAAPPAATSVLMSPRVFWGVLVVAVLVLMTLLVRLMRKSDAEPDGARSG
jgi:hypothetical protein